MNASQTMVDRVRYYVSSKRSLGFQLKVEEGELLRFARYADLTSYRGPITTDLVLDWAREANQHSRLYQARRVESLRCLAKFEAAFEPATEIPLRRMFGPAHQRIEPYIYTDQEITDLMSAALQLIPIRGLRPRTYATLIGLIACTGVRVCEALRLQRNDVERSHQRLMIRETKFHKSRIVPIHETVVERLTEYEHFRETYKPIPSTDRFLISEQGRSVSTSMADYTFRKLRGLVGCKANPSRRPPRLYDLRHTFACKRLLSWYHEGVDLHTCVANLCTYLGHVKPTDTYWYLSATPELMAIASERFERFFTTREGTPS
jgi:integrase